MRRLAVPACALLLLVAAGGCTADPAPPPAPPPAPTGTAAPPPAPGRAAPGQRYAVDTRTLRLNRGGDRPLRVTVWYPVAGGRAAAGRFPVVLFSHGLGGAPADYAPLLAGWAAAGFVVAAPAYPNTRRGAPRQQPVDVLNQPADASYVLTRLLALDKADGDPLRGHLDAGRVAAAGHSAGGITTIALFSVARDERLDAGIVLAGSTIGLGVTFTGPAAPLLFVHGARDEVVSYASGKAVYDTVPWPKALLTLPRSGHGGAALRSGTPEFRAVSDTSLEFLRWSLYGDAAAKRRLRAAADRDVARLDNRL